MSEKDNREVRGSQRYFDAYDPAVDGDGVMNEKMITGERGRRCNAIRDVDGGWLAWLCGMRWW